MRSGKRRHSVSLIGGDGFSLRPSLRSSSGTWDLLKSLSSKPCGGHIDDGAASRDA